MNFLTELSSPLSLKTQFLVLLSLAKEFDILVNGEAAKNLEEFLEADHTFDEYREVRYQAILGRY